MFLRTSGGDLVAPAPPASLDPVPPGQRGAEADSAFQVVLGDPAFAVLTECPTGGLCVPGDAGNVQVLTATGRNGFRWGADSVAYFLGDEIEVRPLGGGVTRRLAWSSPPASPRTATCFLGARPESTPPGLRM